MYLPNANTPSVFFDKKIKEMEVVMFEAGLCESNQLINWCKVFQAATMFKEGMGPKALELLENTTEDYIQNLDNDELHPFLESFYQQIGNMSFSLKQAERAHKAFERLVKCKEA